MMPKERVPIFGQPSPNGGLTPDWKQVTTIAAGIFAGGLLLGFLGKFGLNPHKAQ